MSHPRLLAPALLMALLAGCADAPTAAPALAGDGPTFARAATTQSLNFVHRDPSTPPFKDEVVTVVARAGEESEATLRFADGSPFARLHLSAESLRGATLSGTPIPDGEPVTITLRRMDASRYVVDLQPSGIEFNPAAPAELTFYYHNALLPQGDAASVWKQERAGQVWFPTVNEDRSAEQAILARVDDFTIYALATGSRSAR